MGVNELDLAQTLADAFNTLADEVQTLADRRTVLEHKLRFAHEQVSYHHCIPFLFSLVHGAAFLAVPPINPYPLHDENL